MISTTSIVSKSFPAHRHPEHQLAWMRQGRMELVIGARHWHVQGDRIVWIPGNVRHEMSLLPPADLISAYARSDLRPAGSRWLQPLVLEADPLAVELLVALADDRVPDLSRERCRILLYDMLAAAPERQDVLAVPADERARHVATRILANPADPRDLEAWAVETGVSSKTLMRAFVAETGMSYSRWRTRARMYAAVELLSSGESVTAVAAALGYDTSSGFIKAFRQVFGQTPARYIQGRKS
ncbi:helix-turn-helix domain-containing protein [Rhodococcus sp. 27YEA15]|uniref:helix-turn-helix domain-containing protein n=1 Tax=Rhodococcus sp. 27YEA15 TaxID=3156259 RepID=UPI003C7E0F71